MTELFALPVVSVAEVAARQALLVLDARGTAVHASHDNAGQHLLLQLADDDVARPFALANPPNDSGHLEFIIKLPEDRMARVLGLVAANDAGAGDKVPASTCIGRGFAFDVLRDVDGGADVWLCGVGSGIAPLRAALEVLVRERHRYGDITLLYGVRSADELCYRERFAEWAGLGVKVVPVVSRPETAAPTAPWQGATGYVQDQLPKSFARPDKTHALVIGLPDMEKAICAALLERGVGPEQVHRNW